MPCLGNFNATGAYGCWWTAERVGLVRSEEAENAKLLDGVLGMGAK